MRTLRMSMYGEGRAQKGKLKLKNMLSARFYVPELPSIGLQYLGIFCPYRVGRE